MSWAERKPKLQRFLAGIQKLVRNSCYPDKDELNTSVGKYPHVLRSSLDQVPFNFGMNGKDTLDFTGTERVQIYTGHASDAKRMGTLQIWLFNLPKDLYHLQPPICIAFPGKGGSYYDMERIEYHKDVKVVFQPKVSLLIQLRAF